MKTPALVLLAPMTRAFSQRSSPSAGSFVALNGIREVAETHDLFLIDMWGVMHDGSKPYTHVLNTVQRLKEAGKELVVLSNSSKRTTNSVKMLEKLGFDASDFKQIITSGEVAHRMLSGDPTLACKQWPVLNDITDKKIFVYGSGSEDEEYCNSCGWTLAPVEEANLIVARGTFTICDGTSTVDKNKDEAGYERVLRETLEIAAKRKLPMLITNPDKVRPDEGLPPMPGAIGVQYEQLLSSDVVLVHHIGKPFSNVFDLALTGRDVSRACMVGDALETDITGAAKVGITSVWVWRDGIHAADILDSGSSVEDGLLEELNKFNNKPGTYAEDRVVAPDVTLEHFQW